MVFVSFCHLLIVSFFLCDSDKYTKYTFHTAIRSSSEYGHTSVVELLLKDPRVDPSANNNQGILFHFVICCVILTNTQNTHFTQPFDLLMRGDTLVCWSY